MIHSKAVSRSRTIGSGLALVGVALVVVFGASSASATPPTYTLSVVAGTGTAGAPTPGPATSSELEYPGGIAVDAAGDVYIADTSNDDVEKVNASGQLSIVAGTGTSAAPTAGPASSSPLGSPAAVALDAMGDLYIADALFNEVLKVTPSGTLSVFAGGGGTSPTTSPIAATSANIGDAEGLVVDSAGDLFIASQNNNQIYKVDAAGSLVLYAGTGGSGATLPGAATSVDINGPIGIAVDAGGNLYIAVSNNHVIAKVDPAGNLTIVAGTGNYGAATSGSASASDMEGPTGVAFDPNGNLLIADDLASQVYEVDSGELSVIAGDGGANAATAGPALSSDLSYSYGLAVNPVTGALYVSDSIASQIVKLTAPPSAPGAPTGLQATLGSGSAALSFTPPVFTSGLPITGYDYSTDGGVTWHALAFTGSTTIRGTITGLASGATYQVEVRAVNSVGAGPGSVSVSLSHAVLPTTHAVLPTTGVDDTPLLWFGAILLMLGSVVLLVVRRVRARTR